MTETLQTLNFRDIGGIATRDGRRVRSGVVFRSEGPGSFDAVHRRELAALRIRSVCDLRSAVEREAAPNDWCDADTRILNLDMNTDLRVAGAGMWESLRSDPSPENARRVLTRNYSLMPAALRPHLASIAAALLDGSVPMILHCTAGKDRTGVAIAILLSLLGVGDEEILADYARSDVFARNLRIAGSVDLAFRKHFGFAPDPQVMELIIGTQDDFLRAALRTVERDFGSVPGYFIAGGIDVAQQDALRTALLQ
jgi:protein-tyrosine phosphatase